jgi:hypothetical protein
VIAALDGLQLDLIEGGVGVAQPQARHLPPTDTNPVPQTPEARRSADEEKCVPARPRQQPEEMPRRREPGMEEARPPFPLRMWHWTTARVLYTTAIFVLICYLIRAARETFTLFLFAILFAYFLAPLVRRLERPLRSRAIAIVVVYLVLCRRRCAIWRRNCRSF